MRNIALLIEYDGTAYGGWQVQKNSNSIQAVIEKTLSELLQEEIKIVGAGRTDAGVHAYGQVANFHTTCQWDPGKLVYALNGNLPVDIAIRKVADVHEDFRSRFDAVSRRYLYRIISRKTPTMRHFAAFFPYELSLDKMNGAAGLLIGEKSFKSFTKYADQSRRDPPNGVLSRRDPFGRTFGQRHFVCGVTKAEWRMENGEWKTENGKRNPETVFPVSCSVLRFEIEANRFLHGMVRAIVGTLIDVGRGRLSIEDFQRIVESEKRSLASMSAPACGLFLEEVKYGFDLWGRR